MIKDNIFEVYMLLYMRSSVKKCFKIIKQNNMWISWISVLCIEISKKTNALDMYDIFVNGIAVMLYYEQNILEYNGSLSECSFFQPDFVGHISFSLSYAKHCAIKTNVH